MLDPQELQILAQIVDNMNILIGKIEDSYTKKNGEEFNKAKSELLNSYKKISEIIR